MKSIWIFALVISGVLVAPLNGMAVANETVLARYFDCATKTNPVSDDAPVFTKIQGKKIKSPYKAKDYLNGLDIKLVSDEQGNITSLKIGDKMPLTLEQIQSGLEFGLGPVTAHTVQVTNFNPATGGTLEFGHLKNFFARRQEPMPDKSNLSRFYESKFGRNWGTYKLKIKKDPTTQNWIITDENDKPVNMIYGVLKTSMKYFVTAIPEMISVYDDPACPTQAVERISQSFVTVKKDAREFNCNVKMSPAETVDMSYLCVH